MITVVIPVSPIPSHPDTAVLDETLGHFSVNARSFIEDKMHGICDEAYKIRGMAGWDEYRLHIYAPDGDIKRSYHTDGRAGGPKFEGEQVF